MRNQPDLDGVKNYLLELQNRICAALETEEGGRRFREDSWERSEGGGGRSRVLEEGDVFEKAGINFSHGHGANLPASATAQRPELAGRGFQAMGVSLVIHPRNPYVPTSHDETAGGFGFSLKEYLSWQDGDAAAWLTAMRYRKRWTTRRRHHESWSIRNVRRDGPQPLQWPRAIR